MPRKFPKSPAISESDSGINYSVDIELQRFTGSTLVIGDTIFMSDDGIELLASDSGNYDAQNAYSFIDVNGKEIGGMYGRDDSGANVVGFRVVDEADDGADTTLEITSNCGTSADATLDISVKRGSGSADTYINMSRDSSTGEIDILTPAGGRVRVGQVLNLLGAAGALCDVYIKGTNFIIKYNDGVTRYKYLDLSGTGTTWTHATSEP